MSERRRKIPRVRTAIPVEWGVTSAYAHGGRVVSLSVRGCLIRTEHVEPLYGKTVHLRFPLPDDDLLALAGHVIYYLRDVGFAVEFAATPDREHYLLARLVQDYRKGDPYKALGADALQLVARQDAPAVTFKDQRRHARAKVVHQRRLGRDAGLRVRRRPRHQHQPRRLLHPDRAARQGRRRRLRPPLGEARWPRRLPRRRPLPAPTQPQTRAHRPRPRIPRPRRRRDGQPQRSPQLLRRSPHDLRAAEAPTLSLAPAPLS